MMTDRKIAISDVQAIGTLACTRNGQTSPTPDKQKFISEERRVQDALEDDEVREALQARHQP
jgi:hypothetical protein